MSRWQRQYAIPSGRNEWLKKLENDFPSEKVAIRQFFVMLDKVSISDCVTSLTVVKTLPIWLVRLADRFGLFAFFSQFFALNNKTLAHVIEVIF